MDGSRMDNTSTIAQSKTSEQVLGTVSSKIISEAPCDSVHSKKEAESRKENTPENRIAGADFTHQPNVGKPGLVPQSSERWMGSNDSKRKRDQEEVCSSPNHCSCCDYSLPSSPSKKISRVASGDIGLKSQSPQSLETARNTSAGDLPGVSVQDG
jgi:hypothetical protein